MSRVTSETRREHSNLTPHGALGSLAQATTALVASAPTSSSGVGRLGGGGCGAVGRRSEAVSSPGSARATEPLAPGAVLELRLGARLGSGAGERERERAREEADATGAATAAEAADRPVAAEAEDPPEPAVPMTLEMPSAIESSRAASIVS